MIRFQFRNNQIIMSPELLIFKEFRDILTNFNEPVKSKLFKFIYYMCDLSPENQVRDEVEDKKFEAAFQYTFGTKKKEFSDKELEHVDAAMNCYNKYNNTAEERIFK